MPARTAAAAFSRTPSDMAGPPWKTCSRFRVFFGLPRPSLGRSQFKPSTRASGWQLPQLCQCWKQIVASKKSISPRRSWVSCGLGPRAICVTGAAACDFRSTTASVSVKYSAT